MKRFSILIACMALCFGFSAVSAWAIWEGNAGIAAASEFPGKGLYARSDMFPKNTVVLIENLETGIKVRAVVTGPSGVSGLVALLSPETASALNVRSGSVSRVRISIPTVVSEKAPTGITEAEPSSTVSDPDVNPAVAAGTGAAAIPLESIAGENENPLMPLDAEAGAAEPTNAIGTAPANGIAPENEVAAGPVETLSPPAEGGETALDADASTAAMAAAVPAESSEELAGTPVAPETGYPGAVVAEGENDLPGPSATEASESYYDEPELASGEPAVPFEEELPVEEESVALVPTEMNPPSAGTLSPEPNPAIVAPATATAPAAAIAMESTPTKAESAAALAGLPLVGALAKGSYYVQVASYEDPVNAKKLVDGYSGKYPMVVEKGNDAKLKVCVGPVRKDEYGAIIERFRSLGFKGAFVRKGI